MGVPFDPLLRKGVQGVVLAVAFYFAMLGALMNPWLQGHAFHLNRIQGTWFKDLNVPETFGFLHNQITPFWLTTPDDEKLYSWHILPLALYKKHEEELSRESSGIADDITKTLGFKLLKEDPNSKVAIYFHGTAGTVGQGERPHNYRTLYSVSPENTHVLTVDYRGFGHSSGFPTEAGLIIDATTMIDWVINVAGVSPDRIIIVGQSLGTAVSIAATEHFSGREEPVLFAGLVLIASFTDVISLLETYQMGGYIPILSPLRNFPPLRDFFNSYIANTWFSKYRIAAHIKQAERYHITMIHAEDDFEIPFKHTQELFYHAVNATTPGGYGIESFGVMKEKSKLDLGGGGSIVEHKSDKGTIREVIIKYGNHNKLVAYPVVAIAALRAFESVGVQS
jgi:abhydrolase domain-containing protein 12